ncbi:hypothetical protein CSKR_111570 [Clonorchis sinensis]|uniref:Uncharacterized protein n=1 Tax=Clonorchis sinensis TaxID=79923 RepID=A0A419PHZ5_CLOSI|nr:hypothetical protein CSKR_111570 [Clonorchis sinensis]
MSVFLEISPIWVQLEHRVDGNSGNEINARIFKTLVGFSNLRHLRRQSGVSLNLKGRAPGYSAGCFVVWL